MTGSAKRTTDLFQSLFMRPGAMAVVVALVGPVASFASEPPAEDTDPASRAAEERPLIATPSLDPGAQSLSRRAADQRRAVESSGLSLGFGFRDRVEESGITFRHRIVDDAGRNYKMVHYDHGNGLAVADVDGDGRLDLYFTSQLGGNELWRNLGDGRFEEITDRAGVGLDDRVSVAAAFADADGDGDPDLFVTTVRGGNALFENLGEGEFRDVTDKAGLDHTGHSSGALFFDYDRDGRLDLLVTNVGVYTTDERGRGGYFVGLEDAFSGHLYPERFERTLLYRNRGGLRFEEVSEEVGLVDEGWSGDAAFADLDGNGYPEVYLLNMQGDDRLWHNREGRRFRDRASEWLPETPWGAMGVVVVDFDGDGRLDVYVTDMHSDMSQQIGYEREREKADMQWPDEHLQGGDDNVFGNALYRNLGPAEEGDGPRFEEVSDAMGVEVYWPWGVSAGDLDADGSEDLFVTASMSFPFRYQPNSVLMNDGGQRFVDAAFPLGVEPRPGRRTQTPWFDVDCSGAERSEPYCRGRSGPHTVGGTLGSRSSVILDLDGDGDLDVVTNEFNAAPQVLVSDLAERREVRHLVIELEGRRSNRDGLGALVRVHAGDRVMTRHHDGKSGYLAQSSMPLWVGLGQAEAADRIEVVWPSGVEQVVPGPIPAGRTVEVVEAEDPEE
ncbi:MAG: CRTAC1 family protein [Acidobacteriota bacterium]